VTHPERINAKQRSIGIGPAERTPWTPRRPVHSAFSIQTAKALVPIGLSLQTSLYIAEAHVGRSPNVWRGFRHG
jgi:hypothetical protein